MEYKCDKCNKFYKTYQTLWKHNKQFHINDCKGNVKDCKGNVKDCKEKKYKCKNCNKLFSSRQSKWEHLHTTCKENKLVPNNNQLITTNNTTNNTNNINNGTINNTNNFIVIQPPGCEKISDFSHEEIANIINSGNNSVINCTKLLHFNKKYPQYQSFRSTSLEGNYFNNIFYW